MNSVEARLFAHGQSTTEPICAFVYDLGALRRTTAAIVASLPRSCSLYYATKANADRRLLETLRPLVAGFEVASLGEVLTARAVAPAASLIFGGPGKTDSELAGALAAGVRYLHVESVHELRRLALLATRAAVKANVLLRVNLRGPLPAATLQMGGSPTQFGLDEVDVSAALELARALPSVAVRGFHFHSVSNQLDAYKHVELLRLYLAKVASWRDQLGHALEAINVGGGFGINYGDVERSFDWDAFVQGLAAIVPTDGTAILFESGRFLTAACGYYAAEVLDVKTNHGETFVVVRGGTHHFRLPASWQHSHPFVVLPIEAWRYPFSRPSAQNTAITVVGQLCTPKDVLARRVPVKQVRAGDVVLFSHAGAYGWAISHHDFLSHPHPEHLYVD
jgi:2-[(L-alanin-3-ylcarbamoyl)methyl]-2-hydroxybutanedioate decarboxylase